jgi:hypothetical protein
MQKPKETQPSQNRGKTPKETQKISKNIKPMLARKPLNR